MSSEEYKNHYMIDEVKYVDEIEEYFFKKNPNVVYINDGVNSDSGLRPNKADFAFLGQFK